MIKIKRPKQVVYQAFVNGKVWRIIKCKTVARLQIADNAYFRNVTNNEAAIALGSKQLQFGPLVLAATKVGITL